MFSFVLGKFTVVSATRTGEITTIDVQRESRFSDGSQRKNLTDSHISPMCSYRVLRTTSGYFPKTNINIRARCLVSLEQPIWKRSSGKGTDANRSLVSLAVSQRRPSRIATHRENLRRKISPYPPSPRTPLFLSRQLVHPSPPRPSSLTASFP